MIGTFSDEEDLPVYRFRGLLDEWFYLHAEIITKKHDVWEERIPIEDYFFRYDRGGSWMGKYGFRIIYICHSII